MNVKTGNALSAKSPFSPRLQNLASIMSDLVPRIVSGVWTGFDATKLMNIF